MIDAFIWLRDNKAHFYFKLNKKPDFNDMVTREPFRMSYNTTVRERRVRQIYEGYYAGYVYEVSQTSKSTKVCIYLPDYQNAIITNINNVVLNDLYNPFPADTDPSFELKRSRFTIGEWYVNHFKGKGRSFNTKVKFKFCIGLQSETLSDLKPKFEEFFKIDEMQYTLQDRHVKREYLDGKEDDIVVQDAVVEVECCYEDFEKWYWESGAFKGLVVLEPAEWNDRLLNSIVERFAKRLTKYGTKYDYTLTKKMKPEYEEEQKRREEFYLKWKVEREQRLQNQTQQEAQK